MLAAANSFTGGMQIGGEDVSLAAAGAAGTGAIDFVYGDAATLTIGLGDAPANTILNFAPGDVIDLEGVGTEARALLGAGNVLTVSGGRATVALKLDPSQNYSGETFGVASDRHGGTLVTVVTKGGVQPPHIVGGGVVDGADNQPLHPLAGVSVEDLDPSAVETATLTLSSLRNGALSHFGAGSYDAATGVYTVSGSAAAVTAALQGLVFTPRDHEVAPGASVETSFALSVTNGALIDRAQTDVDITAVNTPPEITGLAPPFQPGFFTVPDTPFAGAKIIDPDFGARETVTIELPSSNGGLSLASPVDGVSLAETSPGVYALTSATPAAVSAALEAIQFTPAYSAGGFTITGLTIAVSDGQATTTASTSVEAGAPVITGAVAGQSTLDTAAIHPFNHVTIANSPEFQSDEITLLETGPAGQSFADGLLSGAGLSKPSPGVYTLAAGTPAAVTAELDALVFTPTLGQVAAGGTVTTDFQISVFNGATTSDNYTTSVIAHAT